MQTAGSPIFNCAHCRQSDFQLCKLQAVQYSIVQTVGSPISIVQTVGSPIFNCALNYLFLGAVVEGLAVDPLSRLIFYTDAGNDLIAMMTMSPLAIKTVIDSSLDRPRAIVLDTAAG